ncbi:hypothetical protein M0638_07400 [Roseomonas sp. NAR14]|uniref:Uncharacterized protein n=1 Tax=Roseomonas acroporae TaxID=2937791 RepID=A0A9X1YCW9_9PROT|nr:hypothetical protein [Roseomonas acroporae]MCK8784201.1 hypothetical protein [Roseomonas acroporae]
MTPSEEQQEAIEDAEAVAREVAPDFDTMLFTLYPDEATLQALRPGPDDLATVTAADRAAAAVLAASGVEILARVADATTLPPEQGRIDHASLRRGADALALLGLDPGLARPRPPLPRGGGTPADRLIRAYLHPDATNAFGRLAEEVIASGKQGVFDVAMRRLRERYEDETAARFVAGFFSIAETARLGPSGRVSLVALPVCLMSGATLPDPVELGNGYLASGALRPDWDVHFLPGWRSPMHLTGVSPILLRRSLTEMAAGREPAALPVADAETLQEEGFAMLLGLCVDWSLPLWEEMEDIVDEDLLEEAEAYGDDGDDDEPEDDEDDLPPDPATAARDEAFALWRSEAGKDTRCVPLPLVPAGEVAAEILDFLEGMRNLTDGLGEITDFIDAAREEVPGEEVVGHPVVKGRALELTLRTRDGRFLDSRLFAADELPGPVAATLSLVQTLLPCEPREGTADGARPADDLPADDAPANDAPANDA